MGEAGEEVGAGKTACDSSAPGNWVLVISKWGGVCNDQVMMMMMRFRLTWVWQSLWVVTVVVKGSHVGSSH